ncbi:MAG: flagellar filament capping protein FliD [Lachnospiraceae bacterium]|nr:flagellar filament capping protein FliD [Lachnospiraceae bacterium]
MPIRITGMNSGLDTESIITQLVSAQSAKKESFSKAQTKLSWKQEAWKSMNSKVYSLYSGTLSNMRFSATYKQKKTTVSDSSIASVTADSDAVDGVQSLKVKQLAKSGYLTGAKLGDNVTSSSTLGDLMGRHDDGDYSFKVGDETITADANTKVKDIIAQLKEKGVNASFDETNKRIFVSAKSTGEDNDFRLIAGNENAMSALDGLGLLTEESDPNAVKNADGSYSASADFKAQMAGREIGFSDDKVTGKATRIYGQNAKIELNGAEFESSTNKFSINGLTITAQKASDQEVTLSTADDYDGIYDTIKKFLKEYNEIIHEFDKKYSADSAKGYEPLTSDEKYAMSDKEVEDWENKIKDSLFRKDSELGEFRDALTTAMGSGIKVGDETLYLADFGISTLSYFEVDAENRHVLHIDGDKDDDKTSANTDKLKAMLNKDPEKVIDFFQNLSAKLYDTITEKTKGNSLRSTYKIYNDKQMADEYKKYTTKIADEEKKLTALEDKWYKKFGAMETALAKLSSKTSAIQGLLGM